MWRSALRTRPSGVRLAEHAFRRGEEAVRELASLRDAAAMEADVGHAKEHLHAIRVIVTVCVIANAQGSLEQRLAGSIIDPSFETAHISESHDELHVVFAIELLLDGER